MGQLRLFYEQPHYEPDCFLSGTPDIPDPLEEPIRYDTWKDKETLRAMARLTTSHLVLVESLEEPLPDNVIQFPMRGGDVPPRAA